MSRILIVLSVVSFLLTACGAGGQTVLNEKSAGTTVNVAKGAKFQVQLEGNPTTGYLWEAKDLNTTVLKQVGDPQHKPSSNAVGAPGITTFTFEAVGPGTAKLQLVYQRPFEKDKAPEKTWEVNVTVK
jgi:inhibitor of cysteine peptidase